MTMQQTVLRYALRIIFIPAALTLGACENGDYFAAQYVEDFSSSQGSAGSGDVGDSTISSSDPLAGCVLELVESRITDSSAIDTTPTLGHDPLLGNLVVYTSQEIGPNGILPGLIRVQLLSSNGTPVDPALTVSDGFTNDRLNDVYGNRVVFTAYDTTLNQQGRIIFYNIASINDSNNSNTKTVVSGPDSLQLRQARIHDDVVVWVQGIITEAQIYYYDLNWLGTDRGPQAIAGGTPAALNVEIGDRYIVYNTHLGAGGTSDVIAIDRLDPALADPTMGMPVRIPIATRADANEQNPSTAGQWVVWETRLSGATMRSTHARNLVTGETRVIQNVGTSRNPSIDGDLVSYEGNSGESGAFDIYVYHLSTRETTQVTDDSRDQLLNSIHGGLVAYVDNRTSFADVFVTALSGICPDIDVQPSAFNFGDVAVGSTSMTMLTISNVGNSELEVIGISLQSGADYAITSIPALPALIAADTSVDVTVEFTPLAEGARPEDFLQVASDDPDEDLVSVPLNGTGVAITVPPSQQIANIIEAIEAGLLDGSISGEGPGNSGPGRLGALKNMILAAGDLIADGEIAEACQQLLDAYRRTDGLSGHGNPPDFLSGTGAPVIAGLIQDLRTDLECS